MSIDLGFGPTCWERLSSVASGAVRPDEAADPPRLVAVPPPPDPGAVAAHGPGAATDEPPARDRVGERSGAAEAAPTASPVLAGLGWTIVLVALVAVVEYWRWVVAGLVLLALVALVGVLLERVAAYRAGDAGEVVRRRTYRL